MKLMKLNLELKNEQLNMVILIPPTRRRRPKATCQASTKLETSRRQQVAGMKSGPRDRGPRIGISIKVRTYQV